jgi:hypothetical protein
MPTKLTVPVDMLSQACPAAHFRGRTMTDLGSPIPPNHVRVSFYIGERTFISQFAAGEMDARLEALEKNFARSVGLAKKRRTEDGYAAARLIALEAVKRLEANMACCALLWMFLYRVNAKQSLSAHVYLKDALDRNGAVWLTCTTDAGFEEWEFTLKDVVLLPVNA